MAGRFVPDAAPAATGGGGRFVPDSAPAANVMPVIGAERQSLSLIERAVGNQFGGLETGGAIASGMVSAPIAGLAGIAGSVLPGPEGQGADWVRNVSDALTYAPRTEQGKLGVKIAGLPMVPVHYAAEKVGDKGAEVSPALGAIGQTSVEAIPVLLGLRAGRASGRPLTAEQQKVAAARDAGFVMTPEEMGAGQIPKQLASLSGEPRLARLTSQKNAETITGKVKEQLAIPEAELIELEKLKQIRKDEGKAYDAARGIGQVAMDAQYQAALDALAAKYKSAASEFKGADKVLKLQEIDDVIAMLRKEDPAIQAAQAQGIKIPKEAVPAGSFEASGAIDLIGALRESADAAFRSGNNPLAKVMRGGAEALEAQIGRHLEATAPNSPALRAYQAARKRIAETYAAEKALVGDEINMQALGRQIEKDRPLTGALREGGEFARDFERSSMKPTHQATGASAFDALLGGMLNYAKLPGLGWELAAPFIRPAMRHILASRPAQFAMDPRTNLSGPALEAAAVSETIEPPQKKKR